MNEDGMSVHGFPTDLLFAVFIECVVFCRCGGHGPHFGTGELVLNTTPVLSVWLQLSNTDSFT